MCTSSHYPFDAYYAENNIITASMANNVTVSVDLAGGVGGFLFGYAVDFEIAHQPEGSAVFSIRAKRAWTTKFFSFLIFIILWLVSICALLFTIMFVFFETSELPIVSIMTALIFALPSLRNSQPGIPSIGCTADVAGFFWNMLIIASCEIVIMLKFFLIKYRTVRETLAAQVNAV